MHLNPSWLTSQAQVLVQVKGPPDRLGQSTLVWVADGPPVPCAHFPAGKQVLSIAQLKGVKVSREVHLERPGLNPQTNRLRVDGTDYAITLVNDWDSFTVLGVTSV